MIEIGAVDQRRNDAQALRLQARQETDPAKRQQLLKDAVEKLQGAVDLLEDNLDSIRSQHEGYTDDVCLILKNLSQTYGSLGGTWRDARDWDKAKQQYEIGNRYEEERRQHCKAQDTYNLLQLRVVQILEAPKLLDSDDFQKELQGVRTEIENQVKAGRNDSWALADQALVRVLCKMEPAEAIEDIERQNAQSAFYESTHTVVTNLLNEGVGGNVEPRLKELQQLLKRKGGIK
jgi:hypothetical protein